MLFLIVISSVFLLISIPAILLVFGGVLWILTGLNWWEGGLLIAAIIFAELAFSFQKSSSLGG